MLRSFPKARSHMENSFRLVDALSGVFIEDDFVLISLDAVSLFTNIPIELAIESVRKSAIVREEAARSAANLFAPLPFNRLRVPAVVVVRVPVVNVDNWITRCKKSCTTAFVILIPYGGRNNAPQVITAVIFVRPKEQVHKLGNRERRSITVHMPLSTATIYLKVAGFQSFLLEKIGTDGRSDKCEIGTRARETGE
ncbi:uncharacterized protein LOC114929598 [Nylanderia fulva]|uniref:uncharacterized protein LOC114929598 n=1 Tax=Nylanderia fulva TaxID=613905 RepID=UPI0010FAF05D|nr:uncharacterized protein LOC114929598 [Nylanderia fulva]